MNDPSKEEQLFEQALSIKDPQERAQFLDKVCDGNPTQREWMDRLLAGHHRSLGFLSTDPQQFTTAHSLAEEAPGNFIGPYKLLQKIGEGGFGMVYMAEQQKPIFRKVALKIIKLGMNTKQVVARFESERQALALMNHSHIANVLDAGATKTGRPYFVMELVNGIPITKFCDEYRYTNDQRLKLFLDVCSAIQHAHQKGIIHRDIKPSNVLVAFDGDRAIPKVIDFGIAKATQQRLTDKTLFTQFQQFIGTPAYMSPEQASISLLNIDTRSDVYSLGVLLYELLVGKTPFDSKTLVSKGYEEIRRIIRDVDPPIPSARISSLSVEERTKAARQRKAIPQKIHSSLRGETDWIVMKALEKDPSRRYNDVGSFQQDIHNLLNNQPVNAAAPSRIYLLRKFANRHRATIITLLLFLVLVTNAAILSSILVYKLTNTKNALEAQLGITEVAKRRAQENARMATENGEQARRHVESLWMEKALTLYEEGHHDQGLAWATLAARSNLTNQLVVDNLVAMLQHGDFPRLATPLLPHDDQVRWVAFSPDGNRIVTASFDKSASLWNSRTGKPLGHSMLHEDFVTMATFAPNGALVATASDDDTARIWNGFTGEPVTGPLRHEDNVLHIAFSPDSQQLLTSGQDGIAQLWNALNGQAIGSPWQHEGPVYWSDFSPDGQWIITGSEDGSATVWNVKTRRAAFPSLQLDHWVKRVQFSPKGERFLTATNEGTRIWDTATGSPLIELLPVGRPAAAHWSADGTRLVTSSSAVDQAQVWDTQTGAPIGPPTSHRGRFPYWVAFSPEGLRYMSVGEDGKATVFNTHTGEAILPTMPHKDRIWHGTFSPDGLLLATACADKHARIWDVRKRISGIRGMRHDSQLATVEFVPNEPRLVAASLDGHVQSWSLDPSSDPDHLIKSRHPKRMRRTSFSQDYQHYIVGTDQETVQPRNIKTGEPSLPLLATPSGLQRAHFSPSGNYVLTVGDQGESQMHDTRSGSALFNAYKQQNRSIRIRFNHREDQFLNIAVSPGVVDLRDVKTGLQIFPSLLHPGTVYGAEFTLNDQRIITTCGDGFVRIFDTETGLPIGKPMPNGNTAIWSTMTDNGHWLATSSADRLIRIWDLNSQTLAARPFPRAHFGTYRAYFLNQDQRMVATNPNKTGEYRLWDLATAQPVGIPIGIHESCATIRVSPDGRWLASGHAVYSKTVTFDEYYELIVQEMVSAPLPAPPILADLADVIANQRIDLEQWENPPVPFERRLQIKDEIDRLPTGYYKNLGAWVLDDSLNRRATPNSNYTIQNYLARLTQDNRFESLREALFLDPNNGIAAARLARLILTAGREPLSVARQQAMHFITLARRWTPDDPEVFGAEAELAYAEGRYSQARNKIDEALSYEPNRIPDLVLKSKIHETLKQPQQALLIMDQIEQIAGQFPRPTHLNAEQLTEELRDRLKGQAK